MKFGQLGGATAIALVAMSGAAFAGGPAPVRTEASVYTPAPTVGSADWSGIWIGGGLGYGSTNYDISGSASLDNVGSGALNLPDLGGQGALLTLEAGYDYMIAPQWVLGGQLGASWADIANDTSLNVSAGGLDLDAAYEIKVKSMLSATARLGYLPSDSTMIYGLAGVTRAKFDADYSVAGMGSPISGGYDFSDTGFTIGAGIETRLTEKVGLKLEYRYTKFDDYTLFDGNVMGADAKLSSDNSIQAMNASITYRF